MATRRYGRIAGVAASIAALALVSACSSANGSTSGSSAQPSTSLAAGADPAIAALVPAAYRAKGSIDLASDVEYPPFEYYGADKTTAVGIDPDLAAAMGKLLGIKLNFVNTAFDAIIPALAAGRYDMASSAMSDTAKRRATVDFLDYFKSGPGMMVLAGNPKQVTGLDSLCGLKVAVDKGTTEVTDATEQSAKCTAAGKPAVQISVFPGENEMTLALANGRADVVMLDTSTGAYTVSQSNGKFQMTGPTYQNPAPYFGIVFAKGHADLIKAVQAALQKLIDDGTYLQILTKYGQQDGAITQATVNSGLGAS